MGIMAYLLLCSYASKYFSTQRKLLYRKGVIMYTTKLSIGRKIIIFRINIDEQIKTNKQIKINEQKLNCRNRIKKLFLHGKSKHHLQNQKSRTQLKATQRNETRMILKGKRIRTVPYLLHN